MNYRQTVTIQDVPGIWTYRWTYAGWTTVAPHDDVAQTLVSWYPGPARITVPKNLLSAHKPAQQEELPL